MLYLSQTVFKRIGFPQNFCVLPCFCSRYKYLQVIGIISIVAAIILVLYPLDIFSSQSGRTGIITAENLNLRPEPGTAKPPLAVIRKGTKVAILTHGNGWLKILHEGQIGYIKNKKRYVKIVHEEKIAKSDAGQACKTSKDIYKKIEKTRKKVKKITQKETSVICRLNEIDLALNKTRKNVTDLKTGILYLEQKISETAKESVDLSEKIKADKDYVYRRLAALYKLNWLGRMNILASAESICELFQRKTSLERILEYDDNLRIKLIRDRDELYLLLEGLNMERIKKCSLEKDLKKQIKNMSYEKKERSGLLARIRSEKALELAVIESLRQAAVALDGTIKALSSDTDKPGSAKPVKKVSQQSFVLLKGLLKAPVKGKIVSFFGHYKDRKRNVKNFRSGIDISADRGEPVYAVWSGQILFCGWFKGYGNMIVIDHDNNYYTVYAHMEELFKAKGDFVETSEVIATVGDTGSMTGPKLYFEMRHHGRPMDPLKWIKKG